MKVPYICSQIGMVQKQEFPRTNTNTLKCFMLIPVPLPIRSTEPR